MLKVLIILFLLLINVVLLVSGQSDTTAKKEQVLEGDDPSKFFTRVEVFNELQKHKSGTSDFYLNQTTFRMIFKIGKRFTTRFDLPFIYNSTSTKVDYKQFGLSDISFRLLGYKFLESQRSAFTASIEISLNTAVSPLIGFGKNIILPVISYTTTGKSQKFLIGIILTEAISFSGDESRSDISYTKLQPFVLRLWTRKLWSLIAPELFVDYVNGGTSMNLEGRVAYAPVRRMNFWVQFGVGLYGDFAAHYIWGTEVGYRYFFMRDSIFKWKKNS